MIGDSFSGMGQTMWLTNNVSLSMSSLRPTEATISSGHQEVQQQTAVDLWVRLEDVRLRMDQLQSDIQAAPERKQTAKEELEAAEGLPEGKERDEAMAQATERIAEEEELLLTGAQRREQLDRERLNMQSQLLVFGIRSDDKGRLSTDHVFRPGSETDLLKLIWDKLQGIYDEHAVREHQSNRSKHLNAVHDLMTLLSEVHTGEASQQELGLGDTPAEKPESQVRAWVKTRTTVATGATVSGTQVFEACRPVMVADDQAHEGDFIKQSIDYSSQGGWSTHEAQDSAQQRKVSGDQQPFLALIA